MIVDKYFYTASGLVRNIKVVYLKGTLWLVKDILKVLKVS